jgi:hypothetical protein
MFKKCLMSLLLFSSLYIFCAQSVIKKKEKKPSINQQKEQIVHQCEIALDLSLELISVLGNLCKQLALCVKEIVTNNDGLKSKDECDACQKRLEQYNKEVRNMVEKTRSFSTSF